MNKVDLKLVLLGQPAVGKTCLVHRYLSNEFGETKSTLGASFALKQFPLSDRVLNIGIWDTAGQERFNSLSSFYCRKAGAAIVCYDITDRSTFDCLKKWIAKVEQEADRRCVIILVGTKLDLIEEEPERRCVTTREAEIVANDYHADLFETSAKTGTNVREVFDRLVQRFLVAQEEAKRRDRTPQGPTSPVVRVETGGGGDPGVSDTRTSSKCC